MFAAKSRVPAQNIMVAPAMRDMVAQHTKVMAVRLMMVMVDLVILGTVALAIKDMAVNAIMATEVLLMPGTVVPHTMAMVAHATLGTVVIVRLIAINVLTFALVNTLKINFSISKR